MDARRVTLFVLLPVSLPIAFLAFINASHAQKPVATYKPIIPKTWDEQALASLEVPLAEPSHSPRHISAEDYYRLPVRPIYKSYHQVRLGPRAARLSGLAPAARPDCPLG